MIATYTLLVLGAIALALSVWILDLVRRTRLYPGYAIVLLAALVTGIVLASTPPVLRLVMTVVGLVEPGAVAVLLALVFIVVLLVYVLTQVTIIANRLATVVQQNAIESVRRDGPSSDDRR